MSLEVSNALRQLPETMGARNRVVAAQSLRLVNRLLSENMTTRVGDVVGREAASFDEPGRGEKINILV